MDAFAIVAAAFCFNAFTVGPMKSYGPFFIRFEEDLHATARDSSLPQALMYGTMFLCGPISSILSNRFGYRKTIVLGVIIAAAGTIICSLASTILLVQITAVITGTGIGLATVPSYALIGIRFKEKRSLVNNIMTMGSSVAAIGLAPFLQFCIDMYTLNGAMLLVGGLYLNALPFSLLMTSGAETKIANAKSGKGKLINLDLLRSFNFITYIVASGFELAGMTCFHVYVVRYAQSRGVDDYLAALLLSISSVIDMAVRPISGYVTSLPRIGPIPINRTYVLAGIVIIESLIAVSFTFMTTFFGIAAATVAYSVCYGCRGALPITITADLFGIEKLVSALGLRYLVVGVFSVAIPPLLGALVDLTGSYSVPFYASAVLFFSCGILLLLIQWNVEREERRQARNVADQPSQQDATL